MCLLKMKTVMQRVGPYGVIDVCWTYVLFEFENGKMSNTKKLKIERILFIFV